jgi:cephalosporin hydroxylase
LYDFSTIVDSGYLPRLLVLHSSLVETCPAFRLRVFSMDDWSEALLERLALPFVEIVSHTDLEEYEPRLLQVEAQRSHRAYCWTAFPIVLLHSLEHGAETMAFLDTDLCFYSDPAPIFAELGTGSIALTPHNLSPAYAWSFDGRREEELYGIFNTGFTIFRGAEGVRAARWWRDRCLEACSDDPAAETGYGDQKYVDDWPTRFAGVRVIEEPGAHLAPWNWDNRRVEVGEGRTLVDGRPLIFYHFASLRLHDGATRLRRAGLFRTDLRLTRGPSPLVWSTAWNLDEKQRDLLWDPYVERLSRAISEIRRVDPDFRAPASRVAGRNLLKYALKPFLPAPLRRALRGERGRLALLRPSRSYAERIANGALRRRAQQKPSEFAALAERVRRLRPQTVVEIGTDSGGTFWAWSRLATPDALLVSVDLPEGRFSSGEPVGDVSRLRRYGREHQQLHFISRDSHDHGTLEELRRLLAGRPVDLLFIDGDHTYDGVKRDFEMYAPLVRSGGLIALHDVVVHDRVPECQVHRFWAEISRDHIHEEFIQTGDDRGWGEWGGIGLLYA